MPIVVFKYLKYQEKNSLFFLTREFKSYTKWVTYVGPTECQGMSREFFFFCILIFLKILSLKLRSLRIFGLLSSSSLLDSQRFGRYVFRPSFYKGDTCHQHKTTGTSKSSVSGRGRKVRYGWSYMKRNGKTICPCGMKLKLLIGKNIGE